MYSDPANIRSHVVKLRLNDNEAALVEALVNYTGQQKASLLRELLLEQAQMVLCGGNDATGAQAMEVPQSALFGS